MKDWGSTFKYKRFGVLLSNMKDLRGYTEIHTHTSIRAHAINRISMENGIYPKMVNTSI